MFSVDVKTVMLSYFMTNALCTGVNFLIWLQYRRHFSGIGHWFSSCILQTIALLLITMRGQVSDFWSMVASNIIMMYGQILMFRGLTLFCRQPVKNWHNQALLLVFAGVQTYFSIIKPDLVARIINISAVLSLVSWQSAWLLFTRDDKSMRSVYRTTGMLFALVIILSLLRTVNTVINPPEENFFLKSNPTDLVIMFSYQALFILLTFSLINMISRSLFREAQEKYSLYRQMFAGHSAIQLLIEPESGAIVEANPAAVHFYGYTEEQLKQMTIDQINTLPQEYVLKLRQQARERNTSYFLFPHRLASSEIRQVEVYSAPIVVHEQTLLYSIIHDVSKRQKAEKALAQKITQLKANLENTPNVGIQWFDEDGRIIYWNRASEKIFGASAEQVMGKKITDLVDANEEVEEFLKLFAEAKRTGKPCGPRELEFVYPSGIKGTTVVTLFQIPLDEDKRGFVSMNVDITAQKQAEKERQKLEQHLSQMQKLDSIGVLAGGIAHDFNNLLAGIFGYIDLACISAKDETINDLLAKAMQAIDRARGLTQQLLTFAKGGAPVKKVEPLFPTLKEAALFALSGSNVSCVFDIEEKLWLCNYDRNQIGQVIDNLVLNAQQAMPGGGQITITARNIAASTPPLPSLGPGNYIKIAVKDHGIGIPADFITRIFDPYFTTKSKGHGLGLSTCYSIVSRHGGGFDVTSEPGKGSNFTFFLPAAHNAVAISKETKAEDHHGSGTFVIMDDEEIVREMAGIMIESFGYQKVLFDDGSKTVDYFARETASGRKIAGMIFDLTIPGGMGGLEAQAAIRRISATTPIFVASGYSEDPVMAEPEKYGFTASISKPFKRNELAAMLNRSIKTTDQD